MSQIRRKIKQKQKTFSVITEKLYIQRRKFTYGLFLLYLSCAEALTHKNQ
jgi:hypothetical protein